MMLFIWHYTMGTILSGACIYGLVMHVIRRFNIYVERTSEFDTTSITNKEVNLFLQNKLKDALNKGINTLKFEANASDIAKQLIKNWKSLHLTYSGQRIYLYNKQFVVTIWDGYHTTNKMKVDLYKTDKEAYKRRLSSTKSSLKGEELLKDIPITKELYLPIRDEYNRLRDSHLTTPTS